MMDMSKYKWELRQHNKDIEDKLEYAPLLNRLLSQRNMDENKIKSFVSANYESLSSPYALNDMGKAVDIFVNAINDKREIAIFGDYDCDGVVSCVMLHELCLGLGNNCNVFLPSRLEHGYGLNKKSVEAFKNKIKKPPYLLIIADCGSNNYNEIEEFKKYGVEKIIIIDHHIVQDSKSTNSDALINWRLSNYNEMCACGQIYQFIRAISEKFPKVNPLEFLTYAAIGTVGDVSPLDGDNRIIVRNGLLGSSRKHIVSDGLNALLEKLYLNTENLTQEQVSFQIVPQINATGRLELPNPSFRLLIENDQNLAELMAEELIKLNDERKKIQKKIEKEAIELVRKDHDKYKHAIFIAKEDWHVGVVGIIASKLTETFNRPAIVVGKNDKMWKGSGRSVSRVNIKAILDTLPTDTFQAYGGHEGAVGVTIGEKEPCESVNTALNLACERYYALNDSPSKTKYYDAELRVTSINKSTAKILYDNLYPYGVNNPEPVFLVSNVEVVDTELKEFKAKEWRVLTFKVKKDNRTSELKFKIFNPEYGGEISGQRVNIYFSLPQNLERTKFGEPDILVKDILFLE